MACNSEDQQDRDAIGSLTTTPRRYFYGSKYKADIESVKDYQAPKPEETAAVKAASKLAPMCNYPGDGFKHMTTDEWKPKKMSDVPQSTTHAATDTHGAHRTRSTWGGNWKTVSVYFTDAKRIDPPETSSVDSSGAHRRRDACSDGARPEGTNPSPDAAHAASA